jgi:hypothetical protein
MTLTKKVAILILSTTVGLIVGYGIDLFIAVALLAFYGDDGQSRPPYSALLENCLFYGAFGISTLIGFGAGLLIIRKYPGAAKPAT